MAIIMGFIGHAGMTEKKVQEGYMAIIMGLIEYAGVAEKRAQEGQMAIIMGLIGYAGVTKMRAIRNIRTVVCEGLLEGFANHSAGIFDSRSRGGRPRGIIGESCRTPLESDGLEGGGRPFGTDCRGWRYYGCQKAARDSGNGVDQDCWLREPFWRVSPTIVLGSWTVGVGKGDPAGP